MKRGTTALVLALVAVLSGASPAAGQDGEEVYRTNCAGCHGPDGEGAEGVFPPLAGNERIQDSSYVGRVLAEGLAGELEVDGVTYDGQMPAFPTLGPAEVDAVIAYIQGFEAAVPATTAAQAIVVDGVGDAARGRNLFEGRDGLVNGGPACVACHTAGDVGNPAGGGFGGDLTDAFERLGSDALAAAIVQPAGGSMETLYGPDPATPQEVADLVAFLGGAATQGRGLDAIVLIGLIGLGVALAATAFALKPPRTESVGAER